MSTLTYAAIVQLHNQVSGPAREAVAAVRGMASQIKAAQATLASGFDGTIDRMKTIASLAGKVGAIGGAGIAAAGASAVKTASQFENMHATLKVLEGSSQKAREAMVWIKDFNLKSPYELGDVAQAYAQFKNQGLDPKKGLLQTAVNVAAAFPEKSLNDAVQMFKDLAMGDGVRLMEFGVKQRTIEAKKGNSARSLSMLGGGTAATPKQVEWTYMDSKGVERTVRVAADNQAKLVEEAKKIFDEKFKGLADERAKTLSGIISNTKDAISELQQQFIKGNRDSTNDSGGLFKILKDQAQDKLNLLNEWAKSGKFADWGQYAAEQVTKASKAIDQFKTQVKPAINYIKDFAGGWKNLGIVAGGVVGLWALSPLLKAIISQVKLSHLAIAGGVLAWRNWGTLLPQITARFPALGGQLGVLSQHFNSLKQYSGQALSQFWDWLNKSGNKFKEVLGPIATDLLTKFNQYFAEFLAKVKSKSLGEWLDTIWQKAKPAIDAISEFGTGLYKVGLFIIDAVVWVKDLVGGWENLAKVFAALYAISFFSAFIQGFAALIGIMFAFLTPAGLIVATLAAATIGAKYLYDHWDELSTTTKVLGSAAIGLVGAIAAYVVITKVATLATAVWSGVMSVARIAMIAVRAVGLIGFLTLFAARVALATVGQLAWNAALLAGRGVMLLVRGAMLLLTSPIGLAIVAFAALAAGAYYLYTHWAEVKKYLGETSWGKKVLAVFEMIQHPIDTFWKAVDWLKDKWDSLTQSLSEVNWTGIFTGAINKAKEGLDWLIDKWNRLYELADQYNPFKNDPELLGKATGQAIVNTVQTVQTGRAVIGLAQDWWKSGGKDQIMNNVVPLVAGAQKVNVTDRMRQAIDTFKGLGWTEKQAIGIAANLKQESEFNHTIHGDGGKAYGLAQWHGDRQAQFAKVFGKSIKSSTFEEQLRFVHYELTRGQEVGAGIKLKAAQTAQQAAAVISKHYERPLRRDFEMALRANIATGIENKLGASTVAKPIKTPAAALQKVVGEMRGQHDLNLNIKAAPGVAYNIESKQSVGDSRFNVGKQAGAAL